MEIKSIGYQNKELSIFCDIRQADDVRVLSFILSAFTSGYFCYDIEPEEIEEGLYELLENIDLSGSIIHTFDIRIFIRDKRDIALSTRKIASYEVIEERKLKLLTDS